MRNILKWCVLELDPESPKQLRKLHNDYPLAPEKIEIKRQILSYYQLKVSDLYNGNYNIQFMPLVILKNQCMTFLIKKIMCFLMKTCNFT